jgi:folate-binding protein YgfZ
LSIPVEPLSHIKVSLPDMGEWFLMCNSRFGFIGCDLYIPIPYLAKAAERLFIETVEQGGGFAGWQATEISRIEAGIPRFGSEMDQDTLPPEVNIQHRAISYSKGCYIGQEIIARIRTYGRVNRTLVGFRFDKDLIESVVSGSLLEDESGKIVGKITSIAHSPKFGFVGLGLVRRTHADLGNVLTAKVPAVGRATVTAIPFNEC